MPFLGENKHQSQAWVRPGLFFKHANMARLQPAQCLIANQPAARQDMAMALGASINTLGISFMAEQNWPASPFGPLEEFDLDGLRFGALISSSERGILHGFFIDHVSLCERIRTYAAACPGANLQECFVAVAAPAPVRGLLVNWRLDWQAQGMARHSIRQRMAPNPNDRPVVEAQPWTLRSAKREEPLEQRFAWIKAQSPNHYDFDAAKHKEEILEAWMGELASQGVPTARWRGKGLQMINNGLILDDASLSSRQECLDAMLALELENEIPAAMNKKPPRI